jgi:hypothetical protein
MFIGHFGIGFGAKVVAPKVSLGSLFVAAQFLDLLWPTLLLLGIETVRAIAWLGQLQWLLVLWGYWGDNHREPSVATWQRTSAA